MIKDMKGTPIELGDTVVVAKRRGRRGPVQLVEGTVSRVRYFSDSLVGYKRERTTVAVTPIPKEPLPPRQVNEPEYSYKWRTRLHARPFNILSPDRVCVLAKASSK
jgi:hypothetical protein